VIELSQVWVERQGTPVLRGLSFQTPPGAVTALVGPNGSGKSTTLQVLAGLIAPTQGTVRIHQAQTPAQLRRVVGWLPELPALEEQARVRDWVVHGAQLRGVLDRAAVDRTLARCGLSAVAGAYIAQLSKGYRQRVGLALALVHDPQVLLLDEPLSGLDPTQRARFVEALANRREGVGVLWCTHDLAIAWSLCDGVVSLDQGTAAPWRGLEGVAQGAFWITYATDAQAEAMAAAIPSSLRQGRRLRVAQQQLERATVAGVLAVAPDVDGTP